ncbi:MAG: hypothetical protein ACK480_19195 [Planctomycetota bacterium]
MQCACYRLVAGNSDYISTICWHLGYLIRSQDFSKGLKLIERHLPWVCQMNNLDQKMWFFFVSSCIVGNRALTLGPETNDPE